MQRILAGVAAAAIAAAMTASSPVSAQVAPARSAAQLGAADSAVTKVQWGRRYWGGRGYYPHYRGGWGWWGPGFATGLAIGAWAPRPYYYGYPYAYRAYPAYSGAVAYCMRRFRSYDRYSRTYLGFDGLRHPCP
jgi:hypothetical protein